MSSLREPRILSLVVFNDSLEAMIGMKATFTHESSLVRLDAKPEVDHSINFWNLLSLRNYCS
jgi:hypothetical protein